MGCSDIMQLWRTWIRFAVAIFYIILLVIAVPLCIWELKRNGAPDHVQAWFVGGMFVLMALPISLWGILQHIINYTTPHLQRYIIRVLWMVPIYALNAWFALRFPAAAIYLDTLRECYEAYVVYNFMAYLLSFLYTEYPELDIQIEGKPPVKHICPMCLLPPCRFSQKFVQRCKHGVLQYTVVRPTMTVIALISEMFDSYGEGDFSFTSAWSYTVIINNMSQILAMYCLVLFYKAFKEELQPLRPVPKFLCVKAVVFMSFWQAVLIAILAKTGAIPENGSWVFYKDIKQVATGLQDFIICIEMFLAAIAHYYSFSHKPFVNLAAEQKNCCMSFLSMWNVKDVTDDVVEHARYIGKGMKKDINSRQKVVDSGGNERTPLLIGRDLQDVDESVGIKLTMINFQNREPPSPAIIVDSITDLQDSGSIFRNRYKSPVNKSLTASMVNFADFRSDASMQHEDLQQKSRSVSLHTYRNSENVIENNSTNVQSKDGKHSKVIVVAEINLDNKNSASANVSDMLENLHFHSLGDLSQDSVSSQSTNIVVPDSLKNVQTSLLDEKLNSSEYLQIEHAASREYTENEKDGVNLSQENAIQMSQENAIQISQENAIQMSQENAIQMSQENAIHISQESATQMSQESAVFQSEHTSTFEKSEVDFEETGHDSEHSNPVV